MRQTVSVRRLLAPNDRAAGFGELGLPGNRLYCPECSSEYVHVTGASTFTVTDDGDAWEGRGSLESIPMECEGGHAFSIRIGFHKGQSFMWVAA